MARRPLGGAQDGGDVIARLPLDCAALERTLAARLDARATAWLDQAYAQLREYPGAIATLFPAVRRAVGRGPLHAGDLAAAPHAWSVDAAARTLLLAALGPAAGDELPALYRHGDAAERCGVLRALAYVPIEDAVGVALVQDALRSNDLHLIASAVGPYAIARLDDAALGQAVLKCVFVGVPLAGVLGVRERVTPEIAAMLARYAHERVAAGRGVPAEVWPLIDRHPPAAELAAIEAELRRPEPQRRQAAGQALVDCAAATAQRPRS